MADAASNLLKGWETIEPTGNTREKLLDVAQELIQTRGINAFSFQHLSQAVGIRKASVHHHFATKADLIESLMARYLADFEGLTKGILASKVNGKTKLKRYCNLFLETLKSGKHEKSCLCGMLMAEVSSVEEPVQNQIRQFLRDNLDVLESILRDGSRDGSLNVTLNSQKSIKSTALVVLSTLEGGLLIARSDHGPEQFSGMVTRLVALLSAT